MAGDWIKVEHATPDKPEVLEMADLLGVSVNETMGILLRFWIWLDRNSCHAVVTHMSRKSVDSVTQCAGFAASLEHIGWAKSDDEAGTLTITNYGRHNGDSAKNRALARDRKQDQRSRKLRDKSHAVVPKMSRLEKRREEYLKPPPTPPSEMTPSNGASATEGSKVSRVLEREQPRAENRTAEDPWPRRIPEVSDPQALDECAKAYGIDVRARHFGSYAELQTACFTARNLLREERERDHARH